MRDGLLLGALAVLPPTSTIVLAVADAVSPDAAVASLIAAGPTATISALLWARLRERDRDHATQLAELMRAHALERESSLERLDRLRESVETASREALHELVAIRTTLQERSRA